jgi:hypothetical protein
MDSHRIEMHRAISKVGVPRSRSRSRCRSKSRSRRSV